VKKNKDPYIIDYALMIISSNKNPNPNYNLLGAESIKKKLKSIHFKNQLK